MQGSTSPISDAGTMIDGRQLSDALILLHSAMTHFADLVDPFFPGLRARSYELLAGLLDVAHLAEHTRGTVTQALALRGLETALVTMSAMLSCMNANRSEPYRPRPSSRPPHRQINPY